MQYYTFMLTEEASWYVVVVVTPMGKWRRIRVPMGFLGSTNWAQATMEEIFQDVLDEVELYIDDIGLFHSDWSKHIAMIDLVLTCLEETGLPSTLSNANGALKKPIGLAIDLRLLALRHGARKSNLFSLLLLPQAFENFVLLSDLSISTRIIGSSAHKPWRRSLL
jgi:hypothetical protein